MRQARIFSVINHIKTKFLYQALQIFKRKANFFIINFLIFEFYRNMNEFCLETKNNNIYKAITRIMTYQRFYFQSFYNIAVND